MSAYLYAGRPLLGFRAANTHLSVCSFSPEAREGAAIASTAPTSPRERSASGQGCIVARRTSGVKRWRAAGASKRGRQAVPRLARAAAAVGELEAARLHRPGSRPTEPGGGERGQQRAGTA